jgi:hypothetical protein
MRATEPRLPCVEAVKGPLTPGEVLAVWLLFTATTTVIMNCPTTDRGILSADPGARGAMANTDRFTTPVKTFLDPGRRDGTELALAKWDSSLNGG